MVAGDQSDPADVLVIGAGPGGYVAALRAAQLGRSVTLIERATVGGLCLNEGCIPATHLAQFAAAKTAAEGFAGAGMPAFASAPDMAAFQRSRRSSITTLVKGVTSLLAGAGVKVVAGTARFVGRTRVCVELGEESVRYFDFKDVVIATGSRAPDLGNDGAVEPARALEWETIPSSLTILGEDYVALQLAVAYARLGARVTLRSTRDRLLPDFDSDISASALHGARSAGVDVQLEMNEGDAIDAEKTVASAERVPDLERLDLQLAGLNRPVAGFKTDPQMRLDRHVFAIGDVVEGLPLAHRAMMQGRVAGDVLGGKPSAFDSRAIPRVVFAAPELAAVGLTEEEARQAGIDIMVGRFPLSALGRAVIESATAGFAKLIFNRDGNLLVGAHLAGPRATEVIAELALAMEMGATADDIALTIHAHPTLAESVMEASEVALGHPIHLRGGHR